MIKKLLSSHRIDNEKCFIINSTAWSENSLLIEVFTENYGRLTLIARGARRRTSQLRGIITLFIPLSISFFGKKEIMILHKVEWIGGWSCFKGKTILTGFYVNELITKLMPKEDPYPKVFKYLEQIMKSLSLNPKKQNYNLRIFEWNILQETGFVPNFKIDDKQQPIEDDTFYLIKPNSLPEKILNNNYNNQQQIIVKGYVINNIQSGIINNNDLNDIIKINRMLLVYVINAEINTKFLFSQFSNLKNNLTI